MLNDLFSLGLYNQQRIAFGQLFQRENLLNIYKLFHWGLGTGDVPEQFKTKPLVGREKLWNHAEEFLQFLDLASNSQFGAMNLSALERDWKRIFEGELKSQKGGIATIVTKARRIVAGECSVFLKDCDQTSVKGMEHWTPYCLWANQLDANDTIVTFNYDRVVEIACPKVSVITGKEKYTEAITAKQPVLLKLHGSVDWKKRNSKDTNSFTREENKPEFAISCPPEELLVATPGPTKYDLSSTILKPLWDYATAALREASSVKFIGFRFPESDAYVRKELLGALNAESKFETVLGPNNPNDIARVKSLINYSVRKNSSGAETANVRDTHLFSQDYLSVWDKHRD